MSEVKPVCGNCAHMREHEQLGSDIAAFCHGMPPTMTIIPSGNKIVRGRPELQGMQMMGLYTPVEKTGGWCRLHEFAETPPEYRIGMIPQ
jgi:hypothetical protein